LDRCEHEFGLVSPSYINFRKYLSFSLPLVPSHTADWATNSSDKYIIGFFLGKAWVGYYGPSYSLGSIIRFFDVPFTFLITTTLSKEHDKGNDEEVRNILSYSLKYFLTFAIPSFIGLSILSKQILILLTTPEIAEKGYFITPIIALSYLFYGSYAFSMRYFLFEHKTSFVGKIWVAAAVINILLNILIIPYIGIIGAALTTLIAYAFILFVVELYSVGLFNQKYIQILILKSIVASLLMGGFLFYFSPHGLIEIFLGILVGSIIYLLSLLLLRGLALWEIDYFKSLIFYR